jgi:hypothetical protein
VTAAPVSHDDLQSSATARSLGHFLTRTGSVMRERDRSSSHLRSPSWRCRTGRRAPSDRYWLRSADQGPLSPAGGCALRQWVWVIMADEQSGAAWGLSYELAPAGHRAEHLSVFSFGRTVQEEVGPVVASPVITRTRIGCPLLALASLVAGLATAAVAFRFGHSAPVTAAGGREG